MPHTLTARRRLTLLVLVLAGVAALLGLAQLVLPGLAARRVRSRVARYGSVVSVHVSAVPAIELLFGRADSARVRAGNLSVTPSQAVALLAEARPVDSVEVMATSLHVGPLTLYDAYLRKRGSTVYAAGEVPAAELGALPDGLQVQPLQSGGGSVRVRVSGGAFGVSASLAATVAPSAGKLVAQPEGVPFGGLVRVTLFSDPRLAIEAIGVQPVGSSSLSGGEASGYRVWMTARLAG